VLIQADARAIPLRDGCVQCVVTSPPYFGLRDYGISQQIGLESSPDAYVAQLVAVFREVRRVLTDDGTVWVNIGDSYNAHPGQRKTTDKVGAKQETNAGSNTIGSRNVVDLAAKQLLGIPWRVAFALQADGWYLRSDIIWHKPNPMPESVTDRPTKSHEYLFLLTKSERYYYDAQAIAEQATGVKTGGFSIATDAARKAAGSGGSPSDVRGHSWDVRNKRSVWTIPTLPYAGAHFATMPEALVEPCILAGSQFGDLIFDPFSGSGTVLAVAERVGRRAVGTDLNPAYHALAKKRTAQRGLRFESGDVA
jgi:DNA modification methylase